MKVLHSSRGFRIALIVAAVLLLVEGVALYVSFQQLEKLERRQKNLRRDLARMRQVSPAPNEANAKKIEAEMAAYEAGTSGSMVLRGEKFAARWEAATIPHERTEAYFDLVAYTEGLRALAVRESVQIDQNEYFGFADYAKGGPDPQLISKVFRQRLILEEALRLLLKSKPASLTVVERLDGNEADEWSERERLSLAVTEVITTDFVRIQFTGETASLRSWLNRLFVAGLPLSVRSVEVQPTRIEARRTHSRASGSSLILTHEQPVVPPLVERRASEFTVMLEILELVVPKSEDES